MAQPRPPRVGEGRCTRARPAGPSGLIYESDNKNPIRLLSLRKRSQREKKALRVTEQH